MEHVLNAMQAGTECLATTPYAIPGLLFVLVVCAIVLGAYIFGGDDALDVEELFK